MAKVTILKTIAVIASQIVLLLIVVQQISPAVR